MSIQSRTSRDSVTIKRYPSVPTKDAEGGIDKANSQATTGNRGTLAASSNCRIQPLSAQERVAFGVRGDTRIWKFLYSTDPSVGMRDLQTFMDNGGTARTARTVEPSRNLDEQGRLWVAIGEEVSNEA